MPRTTSPETRARLARSQLAWALLLAAPDLAKRGLLSGISREADVTAATLTRMKDRLTRLRAEGTKPTGRWARDGAGRLTPGECAAAVRDGEERWAAYMAARAARIAQGLPSTASALVERHRAERRVHRVGPIE